MRKNLLAVTLLFTLTGTLLAQKNQQKPNDTRPNIIFILADDLGYGDIAINGQKHIKTPNIDKLAKQGVRFTQFYAGTSVCAPSRSSSARCGTRDPSPGPRRRGSTSDRSARRGSRP